MLSLEADGFRRSVVGIVLGLAIIGAWLGWFVLARISLYEVSSAARLEMDRAVHPVVALVDGVVVRTRVTLGQDVKESEDLVELNSEQQRLQVGEERTRLAALAPQLNSLHQEIAAEEQALLDAQKGARAALDGARAQLHEAETTAQFAAAQGERFARLYSEGQLSEVDYLRSKAEIEKSKAGADALRLSVDREEQDQRKQESERRARLERLRGEASAIEGHASTSTATIQRLEYEIQRRHIGAPATGRVGEVAKLEVGSFVAAGEKVAAVIAPGHLKVVADFVPSGTLGRVRIGQPAQLRLDGFPWAQYGSVSATVSGVASEVRDGRVRVEFEVKPDPGSPIHLEHGLPGSIEVLVERISPARLVLRFLGQLLTTRRAPVPNGDGDSGSL